MPEAVGPSFALNLAVPRALADLPKVRSVVDVVEQALLGHVMP